MTAVTASPQQSHPFNTYWRSIGYFNLYRLIIASTFVGTYFFLHERIWWDTYDSALYLQSALGYLGASPVAITLTGLRWARFNRLLTLQVLTDICFIVVLMHAVGGIRMRPPPVAGGGNRRRQPDQPGQAGTVLCGISQHCLAAGAKLSTA